MKRHPCIKNLLVGLLWVIHGCAGLGFSTEEEVLECVTVNDCLPGHVCFFAQCIAEGSSTAKIHIESTPPNSSGLLPQRDPASPRDLSTGLKHNIELSSPLLVSGSIFPPVDITNLPGQIEAVVVTNSDIVPLPTDTHKIETMVENSGSFTLRLPAGIYDFVFTPRNSMLPPITFYSQDLTTAPLTDLRFDYPSPSTLPRFNGVARQTRRSPPLASYTARAVTYDTKGRPLLSSIAKITETGEFSILFPPLPREVSNFTLTLRNQENEKTRESVIQRVEFSESRTTVILGFEENSTRIVLEGLNEQGRPLPNAIFLLNGVLFDDGRIKSKYTTTAHSGSGGSVTLNVPEGLYTVTLLPLNLSPDNHFALVRVSACILKDRDDSICNASTVSPSEADVLSIRSPRQIPVTGHVVSHSGTPIADARVLLSSLNTSVARSFNGTTNAVGDFSILVDPPLTTSATSYRLLIEPPSSSALPAHSQVITLSTTSIEIGEAFEYPITISAPSYVHGQVFDPTGAGLAQVTLSFYSTAQGYNNKPRLIGTALSSKDGEYVVPLPTLED